MLMIRFQRIGRRNDPAFRIVVLPKASGPKAGKFVDLLGTYNPKTKAFTIKEERVRYWISQGAQLSGSLHNLLINKKIIEGEKVNVLPRKSPVKKEGGEQEAQAPSASPEVSAAAPSSDATSEIEKTVTVTEEEVASEVANAVEEDATELATPAPEAVEEKSPEETVVA